ncbi:hypothetical protein TNCV_4192051 [Trichonephila clavipes]|nr:hypothetical protein TNCV_4192051 [Trichonephila clavipes]
MGKGQKLFNDGFVSSISFTEPNNASNENFVINCKVRAEMKKRVTYQPSVEIRTTCQIITAKCTCPAGVLLHIVNMSLLCFMQLKITSEMSYFMHRLNGYKLGTIQSLLKLFHKKLAKFLRVNLRKKAFEYKF